ncbi:hypothetical protein VW29_00730 [Devosia limi DSM 17137]|uniref:4-amino-4-deoxy-L-arabinose transferase n=1 Tax=Devosia limi DSM 17137 TaxID=1121477 RepID=A0A0F5LYT9_9HYPH|nr:hypothetical protein [Devosia limi]KKB86812.1 hypothetical protein VW29_00730 [Devosia limi DSM 17137]SHF93737.1 hypothetical protein SAMN02745223_03931 [Devosia limi DSM 17137]
MTSGPVKPASLNPWMLLAVFVVAALTLIARAQLSAGPLLGDTDDAMRMVVVRDFLAGQGWHDLVQHRLDTPYGAEIHWSRLVDVPLGLLVLGFRPLFGSGAEMAAAYVWPLLLLAVLLWVSARLSLRLVGPEAVLPALILPVLNPAIAAEFVPGRIDHHNLVIILTLATAWTSIEALQRPRFALAAGLLAATSLAIATESIPAIAAAIVVFAMLWVVDPNRSTTTRLFGLAFAAATLLHLAIARPPGRWLEAACDMISPVYAGGALVVGVVFTLVSLLRGPRSPWLRLLLLGGLGLGGLAGLLAIYPQCLGGPYAALDPWLLANWIDRIAEAKPWHVSVIDLPGYSIAVALPVLLALPLLVARLLYARHDRDEWLVLLAFLLFVTLVMLAQVRGVRLAAMLAVPPAAWLIVTIRHRYLANKRGGDALLLLVAWTVLSGVVLAPLVSFGVGLLPASSVAKVQEARASKLACLEPEAFIDLRGLPPERILTPIDLGAHMLLETPHAVVAAPYHRNQRGVRAVFDFLNLPIDQARDILEMRGIGLVVTCPAMPEMQGLATRAPDSFIELARQDLLPPWLREVSLPDSPLKVYAVLPRW